MDAKLKEVGGLNPVFVQRHDTKLLVILETVGMLLCDT